MSSTRRLWKHLSSCGGSHLAGIGVRSPPQNHSELCRFTHFCGLPAKLLQYVLLGSSPEDHPSVEANAKCGPRASAQSGCVLEPESCGLLVPEFPPRVSSKPVEPRTPWGNGGVVAEAGADPDSGSAHRRRTLTPLLVLIGVSGGNPSGPHFMQLVPFCRTG